MARGAIEALRADREALLAIGARLSDDDWRAGSGCPGWSVQDVVAHMGTLFWAVVDPAALPDTTGLATEPAQDVCVEARRSWTAADVLADYESVSTEALERLAALERQDFELALGDLGTYPAFVLPNAFRSEPRRRAGRLRIGEHRSPGAPGRPGAPGFRAGSRGSRDLPGVRPAERVLLRPLHPHPRGSVRPARAPHRPATPLR